MKRHALALATAALLVAVASTRWYSHLLFHSAIELFTIAVAWSMFFLAWNARRYLENHYLLVLGIASLFVGALDSVHVLAYKGMGVFPGDSSNLATKLWIAGRYLEAAAFLIAPAYIRRKLHAGSAVAGWALAAAALLAAVAAGVFPDCYVAARGLTTFKIASEYAVMAAMGAALFLMFRHRTAFEPVVLKQLAGAVVVSIASELAFTLYDDVYGGANVVGHLLRFLAFWLMYRAIVVTGLVRPVDLLFRDLAHSEEALRRSDERYRAFVGVTSEGICRIEMREPVPVDLPEDEQAALLLERGYVAECNDAYARMHGKSRAEEITGAPLAALLEQAEPGGQELMLRFIRAGYRVPEGRARRNSTGKWIAGSYAGVIEKGALVRFWGVQHDITERVRAAEERERLIAELQHALAEVKTLGGLLPICASCKKIRDDHGYWTQVESYIQAHSGVSFTHGICPDCARALYPGFYESGGTPAGR
ncbi:MAG: MASE3 domain-containing protein [Bryobacteraceae bacterium]